MTFGGGDGNWIRGVAVIVIVIVSNVIVSFRILSSNSRLGSVSCLNIFQSVYKRPVPPRTPTSLYAPHMARPSGTNIGNELEASPYILNYVNDDAPPTGQYKNLILDIGGVLLQPNLDTSYGTAVPPVQIKRMLRSHIWFDYQVGKLSPEEVFAQLSIKSGFPAEDIRSLFRKARESLVPITQMIDLVARLSKESKLRLFGMTNCPAEDFAYLSQAYPYLFGLFQRIFTSASTGMRKPNRSFFEHVLQETGVSASESIFIDDYLPNIMAAEALDFTAIQASPESPAETVRLLMFLLRTPEERLVAAREYLQRNRGLDKGLSLTSEGLRVRVNFDHFVIADVLNDEQFLPITAAPMSGISNFFSKEEREATKDLSTAASGHRNFPDDLDSTAVSLSVLHKFSKVGMQTIQGVLDKMEKCVDEDGILQTYFDPLRPRVDPVAATNTVYLFHLGDRPGPTQLTEQLLFKVLANRSYVRGTLYYRTPEAFLYQLTGLVVTFEDYFKKRGFLDMLKKRLRERVGTVSDALSLAMRIAACVKCGIPVADLKRDIARLAQLQKVDGSWDVCPYYSYHDPKSWFGNELLTTAFAVAALQYSELPLKH